jgi:phage virion morphogenesis protein
MAGARIDIRYEEIRNGVRRPGVVGAVRDWFSRLADFFRSPDPLMAEIGEMLVSSTKERFQPGNQAGPDGQKWAPNSPVTLARKKPQTNILTHRGLLGDSIRYQVTDRGRNVSVGSDRVYAAMMQYGGTKRQFPHLWGDIPARPFLGLSTDDRQAIREIMRRYRGMADR